MATSFNYKLISNLSKKRKEGGFTLIELLVVVIIIGVLAAVALPNLLGQVGKARETELKNAVGTINRSQQAYHFERQVFAENTDQLGVKIPEQYMTAPPTIAGGGSADLATVLTTNADFAKDGTRAYSGAISFNSTDGTYEQIVCQSDEIVDAITAPADATACPGSSAEVK
jgi:type IV pilus assembly protein PilA